MTTSTAIASSSAVVRLPGAAATCLLACLLWQPVLHADDPPSPPVAERIITAADLTAEKVGSSIPVSAIGEPVAAVRLSPPRWVEDAEGSYGVVDGQILPVDPQGKPINFRVGLPANWARRGLHLGGGGMNGMIPGVTGADLARGFATYGSDSGHQAGGFGGGAFPGGRPPGAGGDTGRTDGPGRSGPPGAGVPGAPPNGAPAGPPPVAARGAMPPGGPSGADNEWALNDEAVRNLGYMQMKKTHDAAMVIIERVYGERPRFNYYIGGSQGGREALTVAQHYPADYDGIIADVPIVGFSSLMLAPALIRIQEKPATNWVPVAKTAAIRAEFIRQGDRLDGLEDGVINNYLAARALFDLSQGDPKRNPWAALRGPEGQDPDPTDTSADAKLSDGQIETLKFIYSRYRFATPLANGVTTFGMWVPNTDPSGSGLLVNARYRGQEGATPDAPLHSHLGVLGVTGFLMRDLTANPLDYVEGGKWNQRREELSQWLDSTHPDLSAFQRRGGKMIVTIGTNDTLASPGAQLDYYQAVIDRMGRDTVDAFARLFVLPQAGHGLSGFSHTTTGSGTGIKRFQIPNQFDKRGVLMAWVEQHQAPGKSLVVTAGDRSLPLCSYPTYPKYRSGPPESAASYQCAAP
ncbi:MAG: tannase/feruloyl esterase family alpha/beta hydrolase [Gammaproteobacteria bacterium]|nr:tannase/feruloyl esterase family alpha/beta hydrolase [Gammaproteobacteria bacterium]